MAAMKVFSRISLTAVSFRRPSTFRFLSTITPGTNHEIDIINSHFGKHVFKGDVAAPYLQRHGVDRDAFNNYHWTKNGQASQVAAAVLDWARDHGASTFCHWFHPLGAGGLRHGNSAGVQNRMFKFEKNGSLVWNFSANDLMYGETDGSSFFNGGLRATHRAGGYVVIDPTSPIFLRDDTIFIPSCFVSYNGHCLDEKTPLLRSVEAMSNEGCRLLKLLGYNVNKLVCNIGLEQEFFFVPRSAYLRRPDLQLAGRTVLGRHAPRGQEGCDHYYGPPSATSPPLECMKEIQRQAYLMDIPLITRHREVAPGQYEFAPFFGFVSTQIDQNLMLMQLMEEIAKSYGLACLLQEKPFEGINGSGKHNNWSIGTDDGVNLFHVKQLAERSGSTEIFPLVMAAVMAAVDEYGDLMRMSICAPGNDFRLGACEAPPSIMSVYLGDSMTRYLESYRDGVDTPYNPQPTLRSLGVNALPEILIPTEDRNRTSPFPYGGHRFEFRAVGSSQNVSLVNTVLATICAKSFKNFADQIEAGVAPKTVAQNALKQHWRIVFNGNCYDENSQRELIGRGLWSINNGIDGMKRFTVEKNIALFEEMKVLNREECMARAEVMYTHYAQVVEIEVKCMIDMIVQHIIPALRTAGVGPLNELKIAVTRLEHDFDVIHHTSDPEKKAQLSRILRLETMVEVRNICTEAERVCPANLWTLATYKELLFIDQSA